MAEWAEIKGFEGFYEVSDTGLVRSGPRVIMRKNGAKLNLSGKILSARKIKNPRDYPSVNLYKPGEKGVSKKIHILVAEAFLGTRPSGHYVCHNNGDPTDNRLENLRYDTPSENSLDTIRHGRHIPSKRTHCPRGHALSGKNLLPSALKNGYRSCRSCSQSRSYLYKKGDKREDSLLRKSDSLYFHLTGKKVDRHEVIERRTAPDADAEMQKVMGMARDVLEPIAPAIFGGDIDRN